MPKIVDHEMRKTNIVNTSASIIAERGFDNLTIRGLASELGISTGMITHYFDSKDEILFAALQDIHARFYQRVEAAIGDLKGIDAIRNRMRVSLPLTKVIRKDWSIMFQFWGRASHHPTYSRFMKQQHSTLQKLDLGHLQHAQKSGEIDKTLDLDEVFEQLDAVTTGMGITCVFNPSRLNKTKAYTIIDKTLQQLTP